MIFSEPPRGKESVAWTGTALWVVFIYLTIPLARTVQEFLRDRGGKAVFLWVTYLAFAAAAGWVVRAVFRREWTGRPVQVLVLAAVGALFSWMTWTLRANPEEAFHYVQYGVLSLLLFRALGYRLRDPSIYLVAALIGAALGIVDELIQWVVPRRYFDFRDIWINAQAVGLIQIALAWGIRPGFVRGRLSPAGIQLACRAAVANLLLLLFCVSNTPRWQEVYARWIPAAAALDHLTAEYGHRIEDPEIGVFFSRLPLTELQRRDREDGAAAAARISLVRTDEQYFQFLKEVPAHRDPLAVEARIHVFRRDRHAGAALRPKDPRHVPDSAFVARRENQIMERYFSNTLHRSRFLWPEERIQRMAELSPDFGLYESAVSQHLITRFSQRQLTAVLVLGLLLAGAGERWAAHRRRS